MSVIAHTAKSPIMPANEIWQLVRSKLANIFDSLAVLDDKTTLAFWTFKLSKGIKFASTRNFNEKFLIFGIFEYVPKLRGFLEELHWILSSYRCDLVDHHLALIALRGLKRNISGEFSLSEKGRSAPKFSARSSNPSFFGQI